MTPVFRCRGDYVAYINNGWLYAADGRYLGWVDRQQRVWNADGTPLGTLTERHYVIVNPSAPKPVRQPSRPPPLPSGVPANPGARSPYQPRLGWRDALDELGRLPGAEELLGDWQISDQRLAFLEQNEYLWTGADGSEVSGSWTLRGDLLFTRRNACEEPPIQEAEFNYRVVEFTGTRLVLSLLAPQPGLPLVMVRLDR